MGRDEAVMETNSVRLASVSWGSQMVRCWGCYRCREERLRFYGCTEVRGDMVRFQGRVEVREDASGVDSEVVEVPGC